MFPENYFSVRYFERPYFYIAQSWPTEDELSGSWTGEAAITSTWTPEDEIS